MPRPADSLANWRALDAQLGPEVLRIASYNVHGCRGSDGKKDAQRIVRVIEECGCDTVGLQEVDYRLEYIAEKLGMTAIPGLTLARHDRSEEHTSELQSLAYLVCRLLLEKKK